MSFQAMSRSLTIIALLLLLSFVLQFGFIKPVYLFYDGEGDSEMRIGRFFTLGRHPFLLSHDAEFISASLSVINFERMQLSLHDSQVLKKYSCCFSTHLLNHSPPAVIF